jgi:hypothetical protein
MAKIEARKEQGRARAAASAPPPTIDDLQRAGDLFDLKILYKTGLIEAVHAGKRFSIRDPGRHHCVKSAVLDKYSLEVEFFDFPPQFVRVHWHATPLLICPCGRRARKLYLRAEAGRARYVCRWCMTDGRATPRYKSDNKTYAKSRARRRTYVRLAPYNPRDPVTGRFLPKQQVAPAPVSMTAPLAIEEPPIRWNENQRTWAYNPATGRWEWI